MDKSKFNSELKEGLEDLNINYTKKNIEQLWEYMRLLLKENNKYNLTNITEPRDIIKKHFLDSLAPLSELNISSSEVILDLGTGPGFPGMVWKIFFPENKFVLIDSTRKKVNFLKLLSARLEIFSNIEILHGRAEDLADKNQYRENFDIVLARAVAPLNILAEYTVPFARRGGLLYYYKGPDFKKEIKNSKEAFEITGAKIKETRKLQIPGLEAERYLLIYKKNILTPEKYPRRAGIPKKRPL